MKAESTVYPKETEMLGGKVLLRTNITEEIRTDEMTGETTTVYVYDEELMSKDEYIKELEGVVDDLTQVLIDKGVIY